MRRINLTRTTGPGSAFGPRLFRRLTQDRSVAAGISVFCLTRAIVYAIFIVTAQLTTLPPIASFGRGLQETEISLHGSSLVETLRSRAIRGDSGWYLNIAHDHYERAPFDALREHNWAFFPLFPILWRAMAHVTGEYELTGMAISNLLFMLALILLHKTAIAFVNEDEGVADRAIFYAAVFPTSYFYSLPMTESLFLFLTVASFYAARKESWWIAGAAGALASATRFTGILLLPALFLLYWQLHRRSRWGPGVLWLLLIPSGLLLFMWYLHHLTGNALAFSDVQIAWGRRPALFTTTLYEYVGDPLELSYKWNFRLLNFAAAMFALACGIVLGIRRQWALSLYTLASVVIFLSSLSLQSLARYCLVLFPVFIVLGEAGRRPFVDRVISSTFITLLALLSALCSILFTLALS